MASSEDHMFHRRSIGALTSAGALLMALTGAQAFDETKYPDWSGQWKKPPGIGNQWDQTKRPGRAQQAPLNPEYQAIFEASLADQAAGGQGEDIRITCVFGIERCLLRPPLALGLVPLVADA